jgi:cell division protein FtsB
VLQQERAAESARVRSLSAAALDPDLLEERAQTVLGYLRPDERVILLKSRDSVD